MILIGVLAGSTFAGEMTGFISDAACGWNNARAAKEAKECALTCVKAGWDLVFVPDGQMDAYKVSDKSMALPFVGDHVIVGGQIKGDTLLLKNIRRNSKGATPQGKRRSPIS
jgi:hypothetical protein